MQASALADKLKYLGFQYATQAGISISIEDLKIPFVKNLMLKQSNQEILTSEKIYFKGKLTDVERFQKIIDTWSLTSESLKEQVIYYFKNYDPLNSVYIMAFSGARGNLSQVRQLVGMRGLMSDPSGEIMNLPIKKNFREGLTITDYLMSGYGARKGIVDTALKTANSGYLTRRLIDIGHDILIREKNCLTSHSFLLSIANSTSKKKFLVYEKLLGRVISKPVFDKKEKSLIAKENTTITRDLLQRFQQEKIEEFYIRSPFTCNLYRAICQKCYGWDLANENLVDIGEAIGILAAQSIGEPGTQLTMRTFHTGGIFTSEAREQVLSPITGILKFSKLLKSTPLRTNRGEEVFITKSSGSIIVIPEDSNDNLIKLEISKNTILFPSNNQYILKDTLIGEVLNLKKQVKNEIKPILSDGSGEIFMPRFKNNLTELKNSQLIWILYGQLYNSPPNSFINFHSDYKVNRNSYIFRTKVLNYDSGFVKVTNKKRNLYQRLLEIATNKYFLKETHLYQLSTKLGSKKYLLNFGTSKCFLEMRAKNSELFLKTGKNRQIGTFLTDFFRTLTGGTVYYDFKNFRSGNTLHKIIKYTHKDESFANYKPMVSHRTLIWLGQEVHLVNCPFDALLVEEGDFISEKFELIPNLFSKTSGIVRIKQKHNLVQTISIKSGVVYAIKKFKNNFKKIYYPGEAILSNVNAEQLSFCEHLVGKTTDQLLIQPLEIFEFPYLTQTTMVSQNEFNKNSNIKLKSVSSYTYKSHQKIQSRKGTDLISNFLMFQSDKFVRQNYNLELFSDKKTNLLTFRIHEKLYLNDYIAASLRYKNIESCLLVQPNQFIDRYTVLGYLEAVTGNPLEIVKFKIKKKEKENKQIFLISNEDCLTVKRSKFPKKQLNEFIVDSSNINEMGKLIIENNELLTLQKGKLYFFPNCRNEEFDTKTNLQYKILPKSRLYSCPKVKQTISLNYYDLLKLSIKGREKILDRDENSKIIVKEYQSGKFEFSRLFVKRNGKLYSSLSPKLFRNFSIKDSRSNLKGSALFPELSQVSFSRPVITLLFQSSDIIQNENKNNTKNSFQLTFVRFSKSPYSKSNKRTGLYSITEDYFEQEVNSVFCKNNQFIESGETIGLLNLEKEITGDIVQGLPRIEEILEARKKNLKIKRIPTSQKKGLLVQKSSLDPNFEFRKLGTPIQENNKINPHKLLKVYFNYYGIIKSFTCEKEETIKYRRRLLQNYEGTYKSFKKVQLFILHSVQSVYKSQGVSINDKHLEVIIKQMTTKVFVTSEGDTPLLRSEVLDLYHMNYINQIISRNREKNQTAFYVPFLLGITKAALNNPSFISAASFQETIRVLTKAAIEGRIDWLRGLKENIIIGHLIPAGTGSLNYRNCFTKAFSNKNKFSKVLKKTANN
jgi:DNA-directed RNA polymerase beta'' subunit